MTLINPNIHPIIDAASRGRFNLNYLNTANNTVTVDSFPVMKIRYPWKYLQPFDRKTYGKTLIHLRFKP